MNATISISRTLTALAALCCGLSATLSASAAELPNADDVIAAVNARDEGVQVTRKLTMTLTDKRGKQRVRETFGYRKYYDGERRTVIFFLTPSNIRDTGFLTFDYPEVDRADDQWLYLPAARKVRRISAADRGDHFLGTDFTYEDIKKESKISAEDYNFKTLGMEEIDGHSCIKIEGIPVNEATAKELGYGKVHLWVDPDSDISRQSEFWDIRMNPLKRSRIDVLEKIDGIWTPMKMSVKNHKTGHQSVFDFADVDYKSPVDDDVFTERALLRGARAQ